MTGREQTDAFSNDLDALVQRYRSEFDLTYAEAVGVLTMKAHLLMAEAANRDPDEEDEGGAG